MNLRSHGCSWCPQTPIFIGRSKHGKDYTEFVGFRQSSSFRGVVVD